MKKDIHVDSPLARKVGAYMKVKKYTAAVHTSMASSAVAFICRGSFYVFVNSAKINKILLRYFLLPKRRPAWSITGIELLN